MSKDPAQPSEPTRYRPLSLHRVALALTAVAGAIIVVALASLLGHQRTEGSLSANLHTVFWYFDVGREYNMATWYGSGLWLILGAVAAMIAVTLPNHRRSWWLLSVVALVASIDEYLELHERLDVPGDRLAELLPFDLGFTWVLVGAPMALVVGLLLLRLVLSLPPRARNGIFLAGAVFLLGALVVETFNGRVLLANDGVVDNAYIYGTALEELLEMTGLAIALGSLASLIQHDPRSRTLRLDPEVATVRSLPDADEVPAPVA